MVVTKPKILELCQFSAGICGVWTRVLEESKRLSSLGYEVRVFSSNATKGSDKIACDEENISNVKIKRFNFRKLGGESFMRWNFEKAALDYSPDIIIVHVYRHPHTTKALKIKNKLMKQGKNCKVFLVTHAPFVQDNSTRGFIAKLFVKLYDRFIGPRNLKRFDKIIYISNWEIPYLLSLGAEKSKLEYIPNGIPEEFFKNSSLAKEDNKILFIGRISPIKDLETPIRAMALMRDKKTILEIVGPAEEEYLLKLKRIITELKLEKQVKFSPAIYELNKKIKKLDSCKIFILSSKKEGMPQSIIEAMARQKIVLGSNIPAIQDLVEDKVNGYLFEQGNEKNCSAKLNSIMVGDSTSLKKKARASVEKFEWSKIIKKIEALF